ncbi:MAG: ABC transporter ATP-binding protein [Clostridiales bacterium]|nr:ABC transporter ATP-binding protein [Peptococcus niger]MDU5952335.1 ABC transporter ATP-binding protein [Clostridiales bacterium]MDU7243957.1 ABC transporter ATP-binding protein [Clostridiales bacterium]MDU7504943.1 ABC transporter ATP-binding protein [Clostridia bacterium]
MFDKIKEKYSLSDAEAILIKKGILFNALSNISKMLPVGICAYVLSQMYSIITNKNHSAELPIAMCLGVSVIVVLLMILLSYVEYTKTFIDIYQESANRRVSISEFLRKLPLSFFAKRDISDLTTVVMTDTSGIEHALAHVIPQCYGTLLSTIVIFLSMLIFNFKMAMSLFWVIPIAFAVVLLSRKLQKSYSEKFKSEKLASSDQIQTTLEMIKEIKSFSLEEKQKKSIKIQLDAFEKKQRESELFSATILASAQMILKLGIATVILVGAYLLLHGEIDLFTYIIFLFSAGLIYDPIHALMNSLTEIFATDVLVKRIDDIKKEHINVEPFSAKTDDMSIKFENVTFGYDDEDVLQNVTFTVKSGSKTALVGSSGSGKSTVLKLAAGFYKASSGNIFLGGTDISNVDDESLLKYYSVVFQDVLLFDGTIMDNIRLGNKNATDDEVIEAAKLANCDSFVSNLPNGYMTTIGENGKLLSGGEKQRISIARAIIKNAPIVLLDEVTSALDIQNENLIQKAISHITKNKTVIVIAHKLNTTKDCDNILVFDNGRIVEQGTHEKLLEQKGYYKKLHDIGA